MQLKIAFLLFASRVLSAVAQCTNAFAGCAYTGPMPTFYFDDSPSPSSSAALVETRPSSGAIINAPNTGVVELAACKEHLQHYGIDGLLPCSTNVGHESIFGWCRNGSCVACVGNQRKFMQHSDMVLLEDCVFDASLLMKLWFLAGVTCIPLFLISIWRLVKLIYMSTDKWKSYYGSISMCKHLVCLHSQGKAYALCFVMSVTIFIASFGMKVYDDPALMQTVGIDRTLSFLQALALASWHISLPCVFISLVDLSMKKVTPNMKNETISDVDVHKFGFVYSVISAVTNDALARKSRRIKAEKRGDHLSLIDSHSRYTCLLHMNKRIHSVRCTWEIAIVIVSFFPYGISLTNNKSYYKQTFDKMKQLQSLLFSVLWIIFHQYISLVLPKIRRQFAKDVSQPKGSLKRPTEGEFKYNEKLIAWREELKENKMRLDPVLTRWRDLAVLFTLLTAPIVIGNAAIVFISSIRIFTPYVEPLRWSASFSILCAWLFFMPVLIKRTGQNYYKDEVITVQSKADDLARNDSPAQERGEDDAEESIDQVDAILEEGTRVQVTGLTSAAIQRIQNAFNKIDQDTSNSINIDEFCRFCGKDMPKAFISRCFCFFSEGSADDITLERFARSVANICMMDRGGLIEFSFNLYDSDQSEMLDREEMEQVLDDMFGDDSFKMFHLLDHIDEDGDGIVTFKEYVAAVKKHPKFMRPAFEFQKLLQVKTLGSVKQWEELKKRNKDHDKITG